MDQPTILNEMDFYEDDATPAPTALTEAMAGTVMTVSEIDEYYGPDGP